MAKSKEIISFEDFNKELDKISEYGSILEDSEFARVEDWISTGNYTLNALISGSIFKGVPTGRFTVFSGPEASGKTFLGLNTALQAQKKGYNIIWIDTESALDIDTIKRFGIDPKKFRYEVLSSVTDVITYVKRITSILKEGKKNKKGYPKIMFVLDSLGNLSTSKEISDSESGNEKVDMTRAKEIKKMFRVLTTEIGILQLPFIVINHVYDSIGFISQTVQGGGSGLKYAGSIIVVLSKAQMKENDGSKVGVIVTAKLQKARFTIPAVPKKIQIHFLKGMNPYVGLETFINENNMDLVGFAPGKGKDNKLTEFDRKEFPSVWYDFKQNKNVKKKDVYNETYFTQEVLEIIDKQAQKELTYAFDTNDVEIEKIVDAYLDVDEETGEILTED